MEIKINGEAKVIEGDSLSVSDLLVKESVKMPDMVSVELNGDMLEREDFSKTLLKSGDEIEFLYFMGGGAF